MDLRKIRKPGIWPLILSGIALIALARTVPDLRREFAFTSHGERTMGWVTSKEEEDGRFIYYAYRTGGQVYGGRYGVRDSDSDFDFTKPGDPVNVTYLSATPYVSVVGDPQDELGFTQVACMFWAILFLVGLFAWLLTTGQPFKSPPDPARKAR